MSCRLKAEPGLADATGAGQGDEAMGGAEVQDLVQLDIAADQPGDRLRQVSRRAGWGGRRLKHPRNCPRIGPYRDCADLAGKLVAAAGNRADQVTIGGEDPAQCRDLMLKAIILDDPIRPDTIHQGVFADDSP